MTPQAGIYRDEGDWLRLSFPFDAEVREEIKDALGRGNYRWEPSIKTWYIREPFAQQVADILEAHGYEVETDIVSAASPQPGNPFKAILDSLPQPLVIKFYRACSLVLHPDTGGSTSHMSQLNAAWEDYQKRKGK